MAVTGAYALRSNPRYGKAMKVGKQIMSAQQRVIAGRKFRAGGTAVDKALQSMAAKRMGDLQRRMGVVNKWIANPTTKKRRSRGIAGKIKRLFVQ